MTGDFDASFWHEHHGQHTTAHGDEPNLSLVAAARDLQPGRALDAGCGEGADSVWLASRGWQVTAVDVAPAAVERARRRARTAGVPDAIDWVVADLTTWTPPAARFDLVSAHYVHVPSALREAFFGRLAGSVAPCGTLLLVEHADPPRGPVPAPSHQPDAAIELARSGLDDSWEVDVAAAAPRDQGHGRPERQDLVLRARRR